MVFHKVALRKEGRRAMGTIPNKCLPVRRDFVIVAAADDQPTGSPHNAWLG